MIRNSLLTVCAVALLSSAAFGQTVVKNDGAMFVVEPGATVFIQGGLENVNGGTINNDGTIEVQGDFINSATFDGTDPNTVIFSGTNASNVTSGGAIFDDVEIDKDDGVDVNLVDNMTVGGELAFVADNNKINVGANNLVIQDNGTITGFDDDDFVVTDDVGFLVKEDLADGDSFTFPVGNDASTYNPATIDGNGGHTTDDFSVRVRDHLYLDGLAETDQATEGAADAMWEITEGTGGGSDVDVTLQWTGTDELTDFPALVGVSRHDGTNWDMLATQVSAPTGADPYTQTRTNVTQFSAFAVGGEPIGHQLALAMKVFLGGAYSGGLLRDDLRAGALVPTSEPYEGAPYNYTHTGFGGDETVAASVFTPTGDDAIVDWVLVELRDQSNPATVLASKSALIQRDGDIVDLDGVSSLAVYGLADGSYHIAVKHRNHLGIRTAAAQALSNTPLAYDFTTGLGQAYDNPGVTTNDAMDDLGSGVFGMWGGNASGNTNTRYNGSGNDRNAILATVGITTPNDVILDVYHICDVNLNTNVRYNGSSNDRNAILATVGITTPNDVITEHLD